MASPTYDELVTQLKARVHIIEEFYKAVSTGASSFVTLQDTLAQAAEGDFLDAMLASVASDRASISAILSPGNIKAALAPIFRMLGKHVMAVPETDVDSLFVRFYDYCITNSKNVNSRDITFGSVSSVTGTGNGTIHRCTADDTGNSIESITPEAIIAECVADQNSGAIKHQETFQFRGASPSRDFVLVTGSGAKANINAVSAKDSLRLLSNPSFSQYSGTAAATSTPSDPTAITNWTVSDIADFQADIDVAYRGFDGDSSPTALRFQDNATCSQILADTTRARLNPNVPYFLQVAVYRESNCDGSVILRMGATNRTVAMSSLSNGAWNLVTVTSSPDSTNYLKSFNEDSLDIKFELTSRTTGSLLIDDVIFAPMTNFAGTFYIVVGGSTAFLRDDKLNWTDSETGAVVQYWLYRAGLGYLPSDNSGSETITDP